MPPTGSPPDSSSARPAGFVGPGLPQRPLPALGAECSGLARGPAPLPWGPLAPPGLPSDIHLTLSASLTESTPIRGKRLFPHPPTHSHSLAARPAPQAPWGLPQAPPPHVFSSPPRPVSVQFLCLCQYLWLGAECGRGGPLGHLAAVRGLCPQEGAASPMPTQSAGSQASGHCSVCSPHPSLALVFPSVQWTCRGGLPALEL